jgi:hypothetical protein
MMIMLGAMFMNGSAFAVEPFPAGFHTQMIATNGTRLFVRVGGHGPAVVLLHGFADTGDMWASLAAKLMTDHWAPRSRWDLRRPSFCAMSRPTFRRASYRAPAIWIMEENPAATIKLTTDFLKQ